MRESLPMPIKQTEKGSGDPLRIGGQVYAEREKKADAGGKDPETQQSIYNLENRTQELYEQLQELWKSRRDRSWKSFPTP